MKRCHVQVAMGDRMPLAGAQTTTVEAGANRRHAPSCCAQRSAD